MPSRLAPDERYSRCDRQSSQTARKIAPMLNARSSQPAAEARSHPATKSGRAKKVAKSVRPKIVDPVLEVRTASATASGQAGTKVGQHAAYRVDIDGLRAVAVMAVIVYHVDHAWLPGGFTGVDVFFVISGYVVSGSLLAKQSQSVVAHIAACHSRSLRI